MPLRSTPFGFRKTAYQSDTLSVVLCSLSRENVQSFTEVEDIYCIEKNVFDYHSIGKREIVKVRKREHPILGGGERSVCYVGVFV